MAEEKKNAAEVQEDTEKEISENETVTAVSYTHLVRILEFFSSG